MVLLFPKMITKSNLKKMLEVSLSEYKIYAPQKSKGDFEFLPLESVDSIAFEFDRTRMSAKSIFIIPEQTMMTASRIVGAPKAVELDKAPQILFGARPCDIEALNLLDDVFFSGSYVDSYYQNERDRTMVIGLRCLEKCRTCFCGTMGSHDPKKGYDIMLTELSEDEYLVEAGTFKGQKLIRDHVNLMVDTQQHDKKAIISVMNHIAETFKSDIPMVGFRGIMDLNWHDELWKKYEEICLSCGQCVLVCPTCWCFDVKEEVAADPMDPGNINKTARVRRWTACLFTDFHTVTGGHVFKPTVAHRLEQYYNHKLKGISEKYGVWGCVGCGRCVSTCPVNIDIRESLKSIRGVES